MEDDNRSVASAGSVASTSQTKVPCPHCAKDFQKRSIFKHIRLNHYKDFLNMTSQRWIDEAANGFPLKITWEGKDERGEDELVTLWVCLATYKTFMSAARANAHFMKNKSALTIHNRELKALKKELESAEFKRKKDSMNHPAWEVYKAKEAAHKSNCPNLARMYWRRLLHEKYCVEMLRVVINTLGSIEDEVKDLLKRFDTLVIEMEQLKQNKCLDTFIIGKCMDGFCNISRCLTEIYSRHFLFGGFFSLSEGSPLKYPSQEYTKESYWLTTDRMPKVDF